MTSNDPKGYYSALGISTSASASEIRAAFRRLAKQFHPDKNPDPGSSLRFQAIHEAYETLGNAGRKARYDSSPFDPKRGEQKASPPNPIVCSKCGRITAQPRYVVYRYVVSFIVSTLRKPLQGIFCAACGRRQALMASAISAVAGWWGFPWGPIYTIEAIFQNAKGGHEPPGFRTRLLWTNALAFLGRGDLELSYALAREVRASHDDDIASAAAKLIELLRTRGVTDVPELENHWRLSRVPTLLHLILALAMPAAILAFVQFGPTIPNAPSWSIMNSPPTFAQEANRKPTADEFFQANQPASGASNAEQGTSQQSTAPAAPTCATLPSNGQVLTDNTSWSEKANSLEIQNGSGGNAIIKIRDAGTGRMLISFFVEDNATARYELIPDGSYRIQYAFGNELDQSCTKFAQYRGAGEFPDTETFTTDYQPDEIIHHVLSYTLYPVVSGNVHPNSIDAATFDAP